MPEPGRAWASRGVWPEDQPYQLGTTVMAHRGSNRPGWDFLRTAMRSAYSVYPQATLAAFGRRGVYVARILLSLPHSRRWLQFLARENMAPLARENPSLYRKSIRPYVSLDWPRRAQVAAMIYHYDFLARRLTAPDFLQATSRTGRTMLTFATKNRDQLTVRLRYEGKFRKEGEATLDLESAKFHCSIASLTFVIAPSNSGEPCVVVGAVYGAARGSDKTVIKETAKGMFGLRPKALLLLLLQEMAATWGVKAMLGVGNLKHPSRHLIYALNRSRLFSITYDDFWRESGGALRSDGLFMLPLTASARDLQTIEAHKRSLYRNRQALVAELRQQLLLGLSGLQKEPPPIPG